MFLLRKLHVLDETQLFYVHVVLQELGPLRQLSRENLYVSSLRWFSRGVQCVSSLRLVLLDQFFTIIPPRLLLCKCMYSVKHNQFYVHVVLQNISPPRQFSRTLALYVSSLEHQFSRIVLQNVSSLEQFSRISYARQFSTLVLYDQFCTLVLYDYFSTISSLRFSIGKRQRPELTF